MTREDLRKKVHKQLRNALILFVVDASESMGTEARMAAAKGAVLSLLAGAYQRRDRVALVAFWGEKARVLLHPTSSTDLARDRLSSMPAGGATPFAHGLLEAWNLIRSERIRDPGLEPLLVILSDGEANVPLERGNNPLTDLYTLAHGIRDDRIHSVAIDTRTEVVGAGEMPAIAEALGAAYHHIDGLRVRQVVEAVQGARDGAA